jgi:hypothetical protein
MNYSESLRPGSNGLPAVYKTAALPGELRRHCVSGAISNAVTASSYARRELNPQHPGAQPDLSSRLEYGRSVNPDSR